MKRLTLIAVALLALGATAHANPCNDDVDKFCGHRQPGMGDVGSCMEEKKNDVSYQCREWMKNTDHALRKLKTACSYAARDYCRDVRPGYGRVKSCLMSNYDKLPQECKTALDEAGH
jgi:hypothetical protein